MGEYAGNWGNEAAVGNGCGNGVWNVAGGSAVPISSRTARLRSTEKDNDRTSARPYTDENGVRGTRLTGTMGTKRQRGDRSRVLLPSLRHACATLNLCYDLPSPCIRYVIETTRLSIRCACAGPGATRALWECQGAEQSVRVQRCAMGTYR